MIELPDYSTFAGLLADPRIWPAAGVSILAGVVRGFAGFGSALIYIPLMSAIYGPKIAAPSFLLADLATAIAFVFSLWRQASWREVLTLAAPAIIAVQFGASLLQYLDPTVLRWAICLMVAATVPLLASGWRYQGRPVLAVTLAVGLTAGLIGGAAQVSGPPIILYWLGSGHHSSVMRASLVMYFALFSVGSIVAYTLLGLMTAEVLALAALLAPLHVLAMWAGSLLYSRASEQTYRRTAYAVIAVSAVIAAPVFDRLFR